MATRLSPPGFGFPWLSIPGIQSGQERIELSRGDALFALQTGFMSGMSIVIASDARQSSISRG